MIRGSDGLDYKDLTAKLLGEPAQTPRNQWVEYLRTRGDAPSLVQAVLDLPPEADAHDCTELLVSCSAPRLGKSILAGQYTYRPRTAILDDLPTSA